MARELPDGTVTFLFTDIEGSTKLLTELGASAYADALAEHRRVVREAFGAHGGVEVDTQGDAFFVAFPTAPGALAAARHARDALEGGRICLRMGLHTGTPLLAAEGYVGPDVHRAARIAAAGHGGQAADRPTIAAGLLARSQALGDELGIRRLYEVDRDKETLTILRSQLDEDALAGAMAAGRLLSVEEAVTQAMKEAEL